MPVSHVFGFGIPSAYQIDSTGQRSGGEKKGEMLGDGGEKRRENDEKAVMAARAEGQMLSNGTKHSKRDGQEGGEKKENSSSWLRVKII